MKTGKSIVNTGDSIGSTGKKAAFSYGYSVLRRKAVGVRLVHCLKTLLNAASD